MIRSLGIAAAAALSVVIGALTSAPVTNACSLLTIQEASTLAGFPVVVSDSEDAATGCVWNAPGPSPSAFQGIPPGVELHYKAFPDTAAAHARFPRWVGPLPPMPSGMTMTPIVKLADEAAITRTSSVKICTISFRHGAALLSLSVTPMVSDTALKTASTAILGRL
jgi:hypothetical protein